MNLILEALGPWLQILNVLLLPVVFGVWRVGVKLELALYSLGQLKQRVTRLERAQFGLDPLSDP